MSDYDLRIQRLEDSVRRLRLGIVALSCVLTGVLAMAAAPAKRNDLNVGRLTASTIVLEDGERTVELSAYGIDIKRGTKKTSVTSSGVQLENPRLTASMELAEKSGYIGLMSREAMPSQASLRVTNAPGQPSTPAVMVGDAKNEMSLMATGLFPPGN